MYTCRTIDLAEQFPFIASIESALSLKRGKSDERIISDLGFFVTSTLAYILLLTIGRRAMRNRQPLKIAKSLLPAWSLIAWVFSLACTIQLRHALIRVAPQSDDPSLYGRFQAWTEVNCQYQDERLGTLDGVADKSAWVVIFAYSKPFEFIDTLFLVLTRKNVSKLHWVHHLITMWFAWFNLAVFATPGIIFATVNASVHAIMYLWYFLASIGYKPKGMAVLVTLAQLVQMFFGVGIPFHYYPMRHKCKLGDIYWIVTTLMYSLYVIIFSNLFYSLYLRPMFSPKLESSGSDKIKSPSSKNSNGGTESEGSNGAGKD